MQPHFSHILGENGKKLSFNCSALIFGKMIVPQSSLNSRRYKYGLSLSIPWNLLKSCTTLDFISKYPILKGKLMQESWVVRFGFK